MPDLVEILVTAKNLTAPAFAEAKAGATAMEDSMSKLNKISGLAAAGLVAFVGESINMASKFDSEMTLLNTQAGVSQDKIAGLSKGVLDLAGQVGFSPDSLSEALFHVESNFESMGITSEKALETTKIAAEGAAVGHANLVDVTNALTAAVASGIPGVQNMSQAMGVLNATVGVGDMKMQDLAKAFGTGMVATVKGYGLSIADVGAALAVFGDNNIRGAVAGTQLRMAVQALSSPMKSAKTYLEEFHMTQSTLAEDMQKGGLKLALEDLQKHFQQAGISAIQQGQVITEMFGKKAGTGLAILLGQMDRLESKYPALMAGANGFGDAWAKTQQTFAFQMKQMQSSLDALMISLGEKLIPYVQDFVKAMLDHKGAVVDFAKALGVVVTALTGFYVISKTVALIEGIGKAFTGASEAMAAYKTRIFEVMLANTQAGESVTVLGAAFSALGTGAKIALAGTAIGLVVTAISMLSDAVKPAAPDVDRMTVALQNLGDTGRVTGELSKTFGVNLDQLGAAVDRIAGKLDQTVSSTDRFGRSLGQTSAFGLSTAQAKDQINALDQSLASMVQNGRADLAAAAFKRMQDAMAARGSDPKALAGDLHKYGDALAAMASQEMLSADSMGALGKQAVDTTKDLDAQAKTVEGLKEAIVALNDVNRKAIDGMAGLYDAIDAASKALDTNGSSLRMVNGELDLHDEKARANEKALSDLAKKTDDAAMAALNNHESWSKVNDIYDIGRGKLIDLAQKMGLSADEARNLADQILSIPDRSITVTTTYNAVNNDPFLTPGAGHSRGDFAHGGIIGAAGGGPRSGMTLVGEQGPELVKLPSGSTVYPASQTRNMLQGAGGGGVGKLQVEWVGGNAGDDFMRWLRDNIRIRGGNVQTVLGQ